MLLFAAFFIIADFHEAQAYLDPGTGSYVFQIAIAFLLVVFATLKNFWRQIFDNVKKFIGIKKRYIKDSNAPFKDE